MAKIKEMFNLVKGSLQSSKCTPGEYNFITASKDWKTHNEYEYDCEALIFAAAASGSLGRTHYVNGKFISSDLCFIITPKDEKKFPIDLKFYHIIFNTLKEDIVKNTKAGTSKEAIGLKALGEYDLPYIDIDKQREISSKFNFATQISESFDTEITHQLDLIKNLRQAFLREAMQGLLVSNETSDNKTGADLLAEIQADISTSLNGRKKKKPLAPITEDEIAFAIPENWTWCRLGEISEIERGSSPRPKGDPKYFSEERTNFHWITISDISKFFEKGYLVDTKEFLTEEGIRFSRYVNKNEFIIAVSGSTTGKCCLTAIDGYIYDGLALVRLIHNTVNSKFLLYYFDNMYNHINDSKTGAAFPNINTDFLNKLNFCIPPLEIQERIVAKLDELMGYCDALEEQVKQSQQTNELLLQQVLREVLGA